MDQIIVIQKNVNFSLFFAAIFKEVRLIMIIYGKWYSDILKIQTNPCSIIV